MGRKVEYVKKFLDLCDTELGSMYSYDLMITLPHADDAKKPENLKNSTDWQPSQKAIR